ncbi:unnamed protein product [Gongylonema pulchrum]|uniref:DUF5405 domain-containing protein n=1 Tax=Gongylonema pulchrum TaxID=637853 RepID=A0A183D742_9BILA|nr:unnamed protein product [Gongylonema pulchrum]
MPGAQYYDGKKLNIRISTEAGIELYERWVYQGISSIMSAIAKRHAETLNEYHRNKLYKCSRNAQNIVEQARCVVQAIDAKSAHYSRCSTGLFFSTAVTLVIRNFVLKNLPTNPQ